MAVSLSVQLGVLGVALWALRSVYSRFTAPSPLDNLPGPARNSFFFGMGPGVLPDNRCLMALTLWNRQSAAAVQSLRMGFP